MILLHPAILLHSTVSGTEHYTLPGIARAARPVQSAGTGAGDGPA